MTGLGVKIKDVVQTMKKSNRPCVVIDCGHGGIDPGKVRINGVYEKEDQFSNRAVCKRST